MANGKDVMATWGGAMTEDEMRYEMIDEMICMATRRREREEGTRRKGETMAYETMAMMI